jgi:hypothetical protein
VAEVTEYYLLWRPDPAGTARGRVLSDDEMTMWTDAAGLAPVTLLDGSTIPVEVAHELAAAVPRGAMHGTYRRMLSEATEPLSVALLDVPGSLSAPAVARVRETLRHALTGAVLLTVADFDRIVRKAALRHP